MAGGCAAVGTVLAVLLIVAHAVQAFSGETLVARVAIRRLSPAEFELTYLPVGAPPFAAPSDLQRRKAADDLRAASGQTVRLRGDQWEVSGGIVKWHPWLTALGLRSYHQPTRLSGRFARAAEQRAALPTVVPLEPEVDWFWNGLYRLNPYLPFVEAVYGSSAYVSAEPGVGYELYVTPSGYLIKRF